MNARWVSLVTIVGVVAGLLVSACAPGAPPAPTAPPPPAATAVSTTAPASTAAPKSTTAVSTPAATPKPAPTESGPRSGGIITRALARDVASFDVQREQGSDASATIFNIYQGLVRLDPHAHDKVVSELAEKWEVSPDGKTYTFDFYKGIKWHDGKPFTTEDVQYSLQRMQDPKAFNTIAPRGQALLPAMDTVQVIDEDTVRASTKYPSASFLGNLASGWIAMQPKHVMVAKGDMRRDLVGTGAFKLKQHNPNISLELTRNPDYYIKGLPYLDGIQFYTITDGATRFAAFRTKRVLLTHVGSTGLTPQEVEMVGREMADKVTVFEHDRLSRGTIMFNFHRKPWDDVRVRQAVNLAIDRQAAIKIQGGGFVGSIYAAPWGMSEAEVAKLPGYRQPKDADIAEAKRLLAEAGFPNGLTTTMTTRSGSTYEPFGVLYKEQLSKIGIQVNLEIVEPTTLYERLGRLSFDLNCMSWADTTGDPDETLFAFYATKGSRNYGDFSFKDIDELIEKQARTLDRNARQAILLEIEKKTIEQAPLLITYKPFGFVGAWKDVRNYSVGPGIHTWSKLDRVWLAK